ncbi:hypothetical protein [Aneurinibacillus sp. REN35]|uniref:hypothetical protein n=1 Tax=Aneurinibacillus sp. REN35 TaxID=3237286 RepID=UPI003529993E
MTEANKAFRFLDKKFNKNRIAKISENYSDDIVQLTIMQGYIKSVPRGIAAAVVPEEWFVDAYEEMLIATKEYYERSK